MNYNEQAKRIHKLNATWWHDQNGNRLERNKGELLMLVVSEIAEAMEGLRKNLMDDHLPHRKMVEVELADTAIRLFDFAAGFGYSISDDLGLMILGDDNKAEQLLWIVNNVMNIYKNTHDKEDHSTAAFFIEESLNLVFAYGKKYGYDVEGAIEEKLAYNQQRADHRIENRMKENGKKF